MAHELSKVRFNSTNEAEAWGKQILADNKASKLNAHYVSLAISNMKRNWEQKQAQFTCLEILINCAVRSTKDSELMLALWGEVAVDAQFYHEAFMYAKGERE